MEMLPFLIDIVEPVLHEIPFVRWLTETPPR